MAIETHSSFLLSFEQLSSLDQDQITWLDQICRTPRLFRLQVSAFGFHELLVKAFAVAS